MQTEDLFKMAKGSPKFIELKERFAQSTFEMFLASQIMRETKNLTAEQVEFIQLHHMMARREALLAFGAILEEGVPPCYISFYPLPGFDDSYDF